VPTYSLAHLSDHVLLRDLAALVARDRATTAALLAHLAEVDARKLYLPAGHRSMYAYCVEELRLSEDAAYKRIQAARAAREYSAIFTALADGRLNLSGVCLLAPYLTPENVGELLGGATGKSKSEIEELIARCFPRSELLPMVEVLPALGPGPNWQLAPGQVGGHSSGRPVEVSDVELAPGQVVAPEPRPKVARIAPQRFALQLTMSQDTHDKLRYAQELLSHQIPDGAIPEVLDRVLDLAITQLEKQKFAAASKPQPRQRASSHPRTIPAHVKRAVWERDGGQCTFISETGRRCASRTLLEFDHAHPVARGGQATVEGIRLRCRAHNQYAAECAFGAEFMKHKRQEARRAAAEGRRAKAARAQAAEVIPWLRSLGFRADEARRAAERCETILDAPLEERVRLALSCFGPRLWTMTWCGLAGGNPRLGGCCRMFARRCSPPVPGPE
jgi:5-methylcytosine-specific restriction endonuclease McrA